MAHFFTKQQYHATSVTNKKSPNVCKSCPNMNLLEKLKISTPSQKLPKNVGNLGKIIVATGVEKLSKVQSIAKSGHTAFNVQSLKGRHVTPF